eukprot:gene1367-1969_t
MDGAARLGWRRDWQANRAVDEVVGNEVKEEVSPEWSMLGSLGVDGMHVAQYDDGNEVDHTLDEDPMEWLDAGEQTGGGYEGGTFGVEEVGVEVEVSLEAEEEVAEVVEAEVAAVEVGVVGV